MPTGKYIVIDGIEATNKSAVVEKLAQRLQTAQQSPVQVFAATDHPQSVTAQAIQRLIRDNRYPMENRAEVLLYNALHSQTLESIQNSVAQGVTVLADYSFLTTLVGEYYGHGYVTDYDTAIKIIQFVTDRLQPDLHLLLDTPINSLKESGVTGSANSIDDAYLERVRAGYLWEAKQRNISVIYATDSTDKVVDSIWGHISQLFSAPTTPVESPSTQSVGEILAAKIPQTKSVAVESGPNEATISDVAAPSEKTSADVIEPSKSTQVQQSNATGRTEVTTTADVAPHKKATLEQLVTNVNGSVYAFMPTVPSSIAVPTIGYVARYGGDVRSLLRDEIIKKNITESELLSRAISEHSLEAIQRLDSQYVVIEETSRLLASVFQSDNYGTYIEQMSQSNDKKDANGRYRYHIPTELRGKIRSQYIRTMNQMFDIYSKLVDDLDAYLQKTSPTHSKDKEKVGLPHSPNRLQAYDTAQSLLPVAARSMASIYISDYSLEQLIICLLSNELSEARSTGEHILREARKAAPHLLEQTDAAGWGGSDIAYRANTNQAISELARTTLSANYTPVTDPVQLISYIPRNELDIVADILYEHSDTSLEQLRREVLTWPYARKAEILTTYTGERLSRQHRPGNAFEKIKYSFDVVCDFSTFRKLQKHHAIEEVSRQPLSPRMGYSTPKLIEEAGFTDVFDECFDLSLQLYSALQASNFPLEAQYATLCGHKLRGKITYNARGAFHLLELGADTSEHRDYATLVQQMHEKIAEVHPLIAESMRFVTGDADQKSSQLAAERYREYRLAKLDSTSTTE